MEIVKAFGFVALGMLVANVYHCLAWRKYYEGRRDAQPNRSSK